MRKAFVVAAILLQVIVLASMAGEREYILRAGKVIHLRTAPIDPRDLFRGDYVRLNYEISRIAIDMLEDVGDVKEIKKGDKVYVSLQEGPNGLYAFANARLQEPKEGVYLTGRTHYAHRSLQPGNPIWINYGIEAYFVEQGKGRDIEKRRGNRTEVQVPLEMAIAVGKNGKAVIKGYRWSPLGIGLQVLRSPQRSAQDPQAPRSAAVRLTLANASEKPLAIVTLPEHCSFSLEPVPWTKQRWALAHSPCGHGLPTDADTLVLAPWEEKSVELDFVDARWQVAADGDVSEIGTLEWTEQFRIVYRPPDAKDCRHLAQRDLIWHGYMPSRVFHGRGQID
jgi:uncharacterized membrane-anchored protein